MPVRNNLVTAIFEPANELTGRCTAAVRGGRFVVPSADIPGGYAGTENIRIAEATAAHRGVIGVSRYDGGINEEIPFIASNKAIPMTSGAACAVGQPLTSDAQGRAVPAGVGEAVYGVAVTAVAGADLKVGVKLKNL